MIGIKTLLTHSTHSTHFTTHSTHSTHPNIIEENYNSAKFLEKSALLNLPYEMTIELTFPEFLLCWGDVCGEWGLSEMDARLERESR